jgi:uncharacterized protein YndB with AHSA1/START domain
MDVQVDENGRRSVAVTVDVPGDRATAWRAIATGAGVSSWMAPTTIDGRVGGEVVCLFGPGMEARARIVDWDPPNGFRAEADDLGPDGPPFVTQWTLEDLAPGRVRVRVEHLIDAADDRYDGHLSGVEVGWPGFFRILALYLEHFSGQDGLTLATMRTSPSPGPEVWARLSEGLKGPASPGDDGRPPFAGRVVLDLHDGFDEQVVLLDEPAPGIGLVSVWAGGAGGRTIVSVTLHLFGADAPDVVARDQPRWDAWITAVAAG